MPIANIVESLYKHRRPQKVGYAFMLMSAYYKLYYLEIEKDVGERNYHRRQEDWVLEQMKAHANNGTIDSRVRKYIKR